MFVLGTAGHIDHGKTALIRALTSIDTDRLPEEKERGMTIDLGFAWLKLPSGEKVGIVDVPGHEDFIKNMIIGATGIDALILVVDAHEGWRPQTEEHFQIAELLNIKYGLIVITKIDLVDQIRLNLVEKEIRERIKNTILREAPLLKVSTLKNLGLDELKLAIQNLILKMEPPRDIGKPRLFIDRVFNIKGSGTVVTGTLKGGSLGEGEEVIIFPSYQKTRLRRVQSYKEKVEKALPGSRVALNLAGVEKNDLRRGDIILGIKPVKANPYIDVQLQLLPPSPLKKYTLKNRSEVVFFTGTKETRAKIFFPENQPLKAGESGLAQLCCPEPLVTYCGDRFILRIPSPPTTIGGGAIIDPLAHPHHFKNKEIIKFLQRRVSFDLKELVLSELEKFNFIPREDFLVNSNYAHREIREAVELLKKEGKLISTSTDTDTEANAWLIAQNYWQEQKIKFLQQLNQEYELSPLQRGFPLNKFQSHFSYLKPEIFNYLVNSLVNTAEIDLKNGAISLPSRKPQISARQEKLMAEILKILKEQATHPPEEKTLLAQLAGEQNQNQKEIKEVINFLLREGKIVKLNEGILLEGENYAMMKDKLIDFLKTQKSISIAQVRELLGISRKYIIPLLNKLDEEKITQRKENVRVLRTKEK